jgi:protein-S-isoprenylcysteine O-methyltransferase Ste14
VKTAIGRVVPERLVRSVYVWIASLLFILVVALWRPVAGDFYDVRGWPALAFPVIQLIGLWFIVQAVRAINPLELAGIRPLRPTGGLQITGAYSLVRHPLYLGWIAIVFGAAHMTADRLSFAAISTAYLLIAVPWEEHSLEASFGDEYARYRSRVRWRVIPYVY